MREVRLGLGVGGLMVGVTLKAVKQEAKAAAGRGVLTHFVLPVHKDENTLFPVTCIFMLPLKPFVFICFQQTFRHFSPFRCADLEYCFCAFCLEHEADVHSLM